MSSQKSLLKQYSGANKEEKNDKKMNAICKQIASLRREPAAQHRSTESLKVGVASSAEAKIVAASCPRHIYSPGGKGQNVNPPPLKKKREER